MNPCKHETHDNEKCPFSKDGKCFYTVCGIEPVKIVDLKECPIG